MSETQTATAEAKSKTEYTDVTMADGRTVSFAGKRSIQKEVLVADGNVTVRFDFRNGKSLSISSSELSAETVALCVGHGLSQKCGDEAAGEKDLDDIVAAVEDMMGRLRNGDWRVTKAAGDSFSGTNVVIKAIAEATGKDVEAVKAFLQKKLDAAKAAVAAGNAAAALSRQELYASFRKPGTATAPIIERLEAEKKQKPSKVSADDLLGELA